MSEYNADNVLDNEQIQFIRQRATAHGPGIMNVYMSDIMALVDTVDTLRHEQSQLSTDLVGLREVLVQIHEGIRIGINPQSLMHRIERALAGMPTEQAPTDRA